MILFFIPVPQIPKDSHHGPSSMFSLVKKGIKKKKKETVFFAFFKKEILIQYLY